MKTVLITGGSSGIGAETAEVFAKAGYNVAISYNINEAGAKEVAQKIESHGVKALVKQAELSKEENAKELVSAVVEEFGTLEVLVNNAGGYIDGDEWDGTDEVWMQTMGQNLISVMNVSKYAIEIFQKQKSGNVVSVASRHGLAGQYDTFAYSAAKAGVINITQGYAKLLAPYGRANSVSPGAVKTGYWLTAPQDELAEELKEAPLERLVETNEIAEAVLYLASDKASAVTGHNLVVDGGFLLK